MIQIIALLISSTFLLAIINLVVGIVLARFLGPEAFGVFIGAIVIRDLVALPFVISFSQALFRYRSGWKLNAQASLGGIIAGSIPYLLMVTVAALVWEKMFQGPPVLACFILAIGFVLNAVVRLFEGILQIENRYSRMVKINFIANVFISALSIVWAWISPSYYVLIFKEFLTVICVALSFWYVGSYRLRPKWAIGRLRVMVRYAYKIWLCRMAEVVMDRLDRGLVSVFLGTTWSGHYHQARYYGEIGQLTVTPVSSFFFERFSAYSRDDKHKMRIQKALFHIYLYIGFIGALVIAVFGHNLLVWVLGSSWNVAGTLIPFFAPYVAILPLINIMKVSLYVEDKSLFVFRGQIAQIVFSIASLFVFLFMKPIWIPLSLAVGAYALLIIFLRSQIWDSSFRKIIAQDVLVGLTFMVVIVCSTWGLVDIFARVVGGIIVLGYLVISVQSIYKNVNVLREAPQVTL